MSDRPTGLPGITGRPPVGAVLSVGIKGPSGAPTEKDRFHIVSPHADAQDRRQPLPEYLPFNSAAPERRRSIMGTIAHDRWSDCYEDRYRCQSGRGLQSHPKRDAACMGDGTLAQRWDGRDYQDIPCPGEKCEFRQGDKAPCKPWMRFLFQLQWRRADVTMPAPLVKFTSGSWNTIAAFRGFQADLEAAAQALDFGGFSLLGMPIQLQLTERTNRERKSRFPVVTISRLCDPLAFFRAQVESRAAFAAMPRVAGLLHDAGDTDGGDYRAHMPGTITVVGTQEYRDP